MFILMVKCDIKKYMLQIGARIKPRSMAIWQDDLKVFWCGKNVALKGEEEVLKGDGVALTL